MALRAHNSGSIHTEFPAQTTDNQTLTIKLCAKTVSLGPQIHGCDFHANFFNLINEHAFN